MEPTTTVSAVSAALASTVKLTEKVFEIRAVDKQARDLLETINHLNGQLEVARDLRRQKSGSLSSIEKSMMDKTIQSTERAVSHVAKLVEPCRVAFETTGGDVGLGTRVMFVLRDSPQIQISLTRLGLASQSLQTTLVLLCSREVAGPATIHRSASEPKGLPTYEESQFLTTSRARNMLRRVNRTLSNAEAEGDTGAHEKALMDLPEEVDAVGMQGMEKSRSGGFHHSQNSSLMPQQMSPETYRPTVLSHVPEFMPCSLRPGMAPDARSQGVSAVPHRDTPNASLGGPVPGGSQNRRTAPAGYQKLGSEPADKVTTVSGAPVSVWPSNRQSWDRTSSFQTPHAAVELPGPEASSTPSTFAFPCDSSDPWPRPLFSRMVKLEKTASDSQSREQVQTRLTRKPSVAVKRNRPLESEFPEVVPEGGLELAAPYPYSGTELLEAVIPNDPFFSTSQTTSVVTEVPTELLDEARRLRFQQAQQTHLSGLSTAPVAVAQATRPASQSLSSNNPFRRHSDASQLRSATISPVSSLDAASSTRSSRTSSLSGRARSERWKQAQFERFEKLQDR